MRWLDLVSSSLSREGSSKELAVSSSKLVWWRGLATILGGVQGDDVAPPPGELFRDQRQLGGDPPRSYGRVLLAGDAEAREEECMANRTTRGLKRSSGCINTKRSELRLRALLTESGTKARFYREASDLTGEVL